MIGIYKIENKITGKVYIGQSKDIERRWKQHTAAAFDPKHSSYFNPFYKDIRKFGIENFDFSILQTFEKYDKIILDAAELAQMKKFNSLQTGYNIQAALKQKIVLEDISTHQTYAFMTFQQVEDFLHSHSVTKARKIKPYLQRAIKQKTVIYRKYYIYYWKGD